MKSLKSRLAIPLLSIGIIAFVLYGQQGSSQSSPPPSAQSFNAHYAEATVQIGAAGDEPALASIGLPVLNRAIRLSVTSTFSDGEISFGQTVACYKSATGECGFQASDGSSIASTAGFSLFRLSSDATYPAIFVVGGPSGTVQLQNYHNAAGSVHVAIWY